MERVFREANRLQYARTPLHSYRALPLKLAYLCFIASTIFYLDPPLLALLALANAAILVLLRAYRVVAGVSLSYILLSAIIIGVDYLSGTLTPRVLEVLAYGYTSFTAIALAYVTTPPYHLRRLLGLNVLALAYLMVHDTLSEVAEIIDSLRARGSEPGINPVKHVGLLYTSIMVMVSRITAIEDSLRARGVD